MPPWQPAPPSSAISAAPKVDLCSVKLLGSPWIALLGTAPGLQMLCSVRGNCPQEEGEAKGEAHLVSFLPLGLGDHRLVLPLV